MYHENLNFSTVQIDIDLGPSAGNDDLLARQLFGPSIPFIISAVFSERRCQGLFFEDDLRMEYSGQLLRFKFVEKGNSKSHSIDVPLETIRTEQYGDRAVELVLNGPIDVWKLKGNRWVININIKLIITIKFFK